jgi:hypothetical protein
MSTTGEIKKQIGYVTGVDNRKAGIETRDGFRVTCYWCGHSHALVLTSRTMMVRKCDLIPALRFRVANDAKCRYWTL